MMKTFTWIVTICLGLIIGALVFMRFSPDYNLYLVRSESMVPALNMGDMIITGPLDGPLGNGTPPGTIVTYKQGKGVVTHRVLAIEDGRLITKGDAAEDPDPWRVSMSNIVGVQVLRVPYIGMVSTS